MKLPPLLALLPGAGTTACEGQPGHYPTRAHQGPKPFQDMARTRGAARDRLAESQGDLLNGKTKYENPTAGDRYRVDDRYNHVYPDRNGALHGSNVPLDAGALNWSELQWVESKNY